MEEIKDQLFSTLPLLKEKVVLVNGKKVVEDDYIPNSEHPYDHYIIEGEI